MIGHWAVASMLVLSIIMQAIAAVMALRLLAVTDRKVAWGMVAMGVTLMGIRRSLPLPGILSQDVEPDALNEALALLVSVLIAGGIAGLRPLFTGRVLAEAALREREHHIEQLIDESPLPMVVSAGPDERTLLVNRRFTELFGYTIAQMPDVAHWWPLAYPDAAYRDRIRKRWAANLEEAIRTRGQVEPIEALVQCRDGSRRHVEFRLSSIGDRHLVTFVDLTAHRQVEEALHRREEEFRALVENSPDFVTRHDLMGRLVYCNPAVSSLLGRPTAEILGKTTPELTPGARAGRVFHDAVMRVLETGRPMEIEFVQDGIVVEKEPVHHTRLVPERDRAGNVASVLSVGRDISALKEAERQLRTLVENLPDLVARFDLAGRFQFVNSVMTRAFQAPAERFLGKTIEELAASPEERDTNHRLLEGTLRATREGVPNLLEISMRLREGDRHLEVRNVPERDSAGQVVSVLSIARDVTERKRADAELRQHRGHLEELVAERTAALEAANHEMEAFSFSVSHDLRTPLRAIDGFSRLLIAKHASALDEQARHLLEVVRENTTRMERLIDDILAFSRAGRIELKSVEVDMAQLVHLAWDELEPSRVGRELELDVRALAPCKGDPAMLRQVWLNLLANAIKFTRPVPKARIEVRSSVSELESTYSVRDNGVGFDPVYQHKLFVVFQRLHGMEEFEGTGVGLAIVKRIVTRHGGSVFAEGKVGEGALIRFTLPVAPLTSAGR